MRRYRVLIVDTRLFGVKPVAGYQQEPRPGRLSMLLISNRDGPVQLAIADVHGLACRLFLGYGTQHPAHLLELPRFVDTRLDPGGSPAETGSDLESRGNRP